MRIKWQLFLDDVCTPRSFPSNMEGPNGAMPYGIETKQEEIPLLLWATSYDMAVFYLQCYGPPEVMYLDFNIVGHENGMDVLVEAKRMYPNNPPHTVRYLTGSWEAERDMRKFVEEWKTQ
jgi:hypothetical protein